jgi:phosphate starvation-inducible protein PhoH
VSASSPDADVVRHVMVQRIVRAYEDYERSAPKGTGKGETK